jgi:signal transduction histidine kinase
MSRSNKNLLQMVNTLLEVYRFEAGRKTMTFFPVAVQDLLQEVVKELTPLAEEKKLVLQLQIEQPPASGKILGDRLELHRLFTNLVGNAIKFTDAGSVNVRLLPDNNPATSMIIEVEDTGCGVPTEEQATLFERFRQGSHKRSGSGLGLYLSRRIVEAHQGTIKVKSELGKGSVFIVHLPVRQ